MDNKDGGYEFYVSPKGDPNFRSAYFFQPDKPYNKDGPGQLIAYDYGYDRIDATNLKNAVELAKKNLLIVTGKQCADLKFGSPLGHT